MTGRLPIILIITFSLLLNFCNKEDIYITNETDSKTVLNGIYERIINFSSTNEDRKQNRQFIKLSIMDLTFSVLVIDTDSLPRFTCDFCGTYEIKSVNMIFHTTVPENCEYNPDDLPSGYFSCFFKPNSAGHDSIIIEQYDSLLDVYKAIRSSIYF